jgi:hypothetical protein
MATVTIYSDAGDDYLDCASLVYADARSGAGTVSSNAGSTTNRIGQTLVSTTYTCFESFLPFDTSSLSGATITGATLSLWCTQDLSTTDFTAEARLFDFGASIEVGDWVAGASLGSSTLLATLASSGLVVGAYNAFTQSGTNLKDNINTAGQTRMLFASDRMSSGTTPTGNEYALFSSANASGTTQDPKLVVSTLSVSSDTTLNPVSDLTINSWTSDAGGTTAIYQAIDESAADDNDYVQSSAGATSSDYYETELESYSDPTSSSGHVAHYRYKKNVSGGAINLTASLRQGTAGASVSYETEDTPSSLAYDTASGNQNGFAQSFSWGGGGLLSVELKVSKSVSPTDNLRLEIQTNSGSVPSETVLASAVVSGASVPGGGGTWVTFTLGPAFIAAQTLWLVVERTGPTDVVNGFVWYYDSGAGYAGGSAASRSGTTWTADATKDYAFRVNGGNEIASWAHTGISNSWTTANQTLTAPQADSITDYGALCLRFTPNMTASDVTPTKVADRGTSTQATLADPIACDMAAAGSITVGNYLIARVSAENSGGGGAARTLAVDDPRGNSWTVISNNYDPGAASAGVTAHLCYTKVVNAYTNGDDISFNYSGTVRHAAVIEEWSGIHATSPVAVTSTTTTGTSTSAGGISRNPTAVGQLMYAMAAIEGPNGDSYTEDSDTTDGTWSSLTGLGTANATAEDNQKVVGGYKVVTGTSTQTWTGTITSRDWSSIAIVFAPAAPTIRTQVSWANFELPAAVTKFVRMTLRVLQAVVRASNW